MSDWYDRDGRELVSPHIEIGSPVWRAAMQTVEELLTDEEYKRVDENFVGDYRISTVWLGINHNFRPEEAPLIFETMIFYHGSGEDPLDLDLYCVRYCTESEAFDGHQGVIRKVVAKIHGFDIDVLELEG